MREYARRGDMAGHTFARAVARNNHRQTRLKRRLDVGRERRRR